MTRKLQVLHVVRPASGGMRQHVLNIVNTRVGNGVEFAIAGPSKFLDELPECLSDVAKFRVEIAPTTRAISDVSGAARISSLVRTHKIDLVHAHGVRSGFVCALAASVSPLKFIVTLHNDPPKSKLSAYVLRFIASKARKIVAVSLYIRDSAVSAGIANSSIDIIPNGVSDDWFAETVPRPRVANGHMIIGYVGRIAKEKGIRVLVQAAHILPDVTILVAGSGPLDDEVRSSAPANMRMLGRVADPRSVYAESDIVAVPSLEEGQGITALEAMAQGCPIVASDVGGLGAMLDNGVTALLVPPGDPESLARALRQLLESPVLAANLSVNAYKVAARDYRLSNMMQSLYNLYSNVTQSP